MDLRRRLLMQMIGGETKMVEIGTYTPSEDISASTAQIPHSLGVMPDFVVVMAEAFTATTDMQKWYISNSYCSKANLIASNKNVDGFAAYQVSDRGKDACVRRCEDVNYTKFLSANYFLVPFYNSNETLKAGITYHYVIGKFE